MATQLLSGVNPDAALSPHLYDEVKRVPSRDGYGEGLVDLGETNPNVMVLCADLTESTRTHWFKQKFPERFLQLGIAEQNMLAVAGGLSLEGFIPFVSDYSAFVPGRCWDQLRVSVCYGFLNVKIGGAHSGISVGPDGATHQILEDVAITRVLPRMTVMVPCDSVECRKATVTAAEIVGPVFVRFGREKVPVVTTPDTPFEIGKAQVFHFGADVTVVACGAMTYQALLAARDLEGEGISVRVINSPFIKPLDVETIAQAARETGAVVTAEEHQISGGLGGAVAEVLGETCPVPMKRVGVLDRFGESGDPDELMREFGLTKQEIITAIRDVLARKRA